MEVDRFFIKEKLDQEIVELPKIRSEDQLADILTKAVSSRVFSKFLGKLGMCDIYAPTWGGVLRYGLILSYSYPFFPILSMILSYHVDDCFLSF